MKSSLQAAWEYCEEVLPLVSRTFALNIRRLTGPLYQAVLIGYLLFRMADTLEDSLYLSEDEKINGLTFFSQLLGSDLPSTCFLHTIHPWIGKIDSDTQEGDLISHGDRVLQCYAQLPKFHQDIIGRAIKETSLGMADYQKRKRGHSHKIFQLKDWNDLTRYCYYVAGVVGKMLTKLFCLDDQLSPLYIQLARQQIHFGIALQMTNIAKDYPSDLARGWCYLPETLTGELGLTPHDLLARHSLKRPEITSLMIEKILPHLDGAYRYIATIPLSLKRIRMFCIIPFTLAYHTLDHLIRTQSEKLSREQVWEILEISETFCSSNAALKADYEQTLRHSPWIPS